jgi:hypothetical protein
MTMPDGVQRASQYHFDKNFRQNGRNAFAEAMFCGSIDLSGPFRMSRFEP